MRSMTSGRRLVASAALALVLGLVALSPSIVRADGPASEPAAASFETEFLTNMIDHHSMANEMAMVCQGKDVRADLEQLCGEIIAAQSQEIDEMQKTPTSMMPKGLLDRYSKDEILEIVAYIESLQQQ